MIYPTAAAIAMHMMLQDIGTSPWPQMPPPRFDHAYRGHLTVKTVQTQQEIYRLCHDNFARACAYPAGNRCTIILPANGAPVILDALRRHETAHCNGWPANHPSY